MPYQIEKREEKYCVVKVIEGGTNTLVNGGCHPSRADAIKHQRALYANEARVASLYEKIDAEEQSIDQAVQEVKVVLQQDPSLSAAVVASLEQIVERLEAGGKVTEALLSSLQAAAAPPTINVQPTPIHVRVEAAPPPNVQVNPEIHLPEQKRDVRFQRDPAGRITGAVVEDG